MEKVSDPVVGVPTGQNAEVIYFGRSSMGVRGKSRVPVIGVPNDQIAATIYLRFNIKLPQSLKYAGHRNSYTELNVPYFWTITIKNWIHLLKPDDYKNIVIESLQWLCKNNLVHIYGYVIMPNHLHLLWSQLKMNGKEYPKNSFEKFTSHKFKRKLQKENPEDLEKFKIDASDREYNFWLRDPLAIQILSKEMAVQKLNYMHTNPVQEYWKLCNTPEQYRYSSALFYESQYDEFKILTHYLEDL